MIDLHCHMLPGIDDGATDLDTALTMARLAVSDGIRIVACTPHIYPGLYPNTGPGIRQAVTAFRAQLEEADVDLEITYGADAHLTPDLLSNLRNREVPSLHGTRYFLLEPPHHVAPPHLQDFVFGLVAAGYVPVVTHPERLTWIQDHYEIFPALVHSGAWMQITAGSLTGHFGSAAKYWGERLLDEGLTHILATDAHGIKNRPPTMSEGLRVAERWLGAEEARHLVDTRPQAILNNLDPAQTPPLPAGTDSHGPSRRGKSFFKRLFGRI